MLFLALMLLTSCGSSIDRKGSSDVNVMKIDSEGINSVMKSEAKFEQLIESLGSSEFSEQSKKSLNLWIDSLVELLSVTDATFLKRSEDHLFTKITKRIEGEARRNLSSSSFRWMGWTFRDLKYEKKNLERSFGAPEFVGSMEEFFPLFAYILGLCKHNVNISFLDVSKLDHIVAQELKLIEAMSKAAIKEAKSEVKEGKASEEIEAIIKLSKKFSIHKIIVQIIKDYQRGQGVKFNIKDMPHFTAEDERLTPDIFKRGTGQDFSSTINKALETFAKNLERIIKPKQPDGTEPGEREIDAGGMVFHSG